MTLKTRISLHFKTTTDVNVTPFSDLKIQVELSQARISPNFLKFQLVASQILLRGLSKFSDLTWI